MRANQQKVSFAGFLFTHRKGTFCELTLFKNTKTTKIQPPPQEISSLGILLSFEREEFNPNPHILFGRKSRVSGTVCTYDTLRLLWNCWTQAGGLRCSTWVPSCHHKNVQNTRVGAGLWRLWLNLPEWDLRFCEVFSCRCSFPLELSAPVWVASHLSSSFSPLFLSIRCTVEQAKLVLNSPPSPLLRVSSHPSLWPCSRKNPVVIQDSWEELWAF